MQWKKLIKYFKLEEKLNKISSNRYKRSSNITVLKIEVLALKENIIPLKGRKQNQITLYIILVTKIKEKN